jgi:hypothetical protein
MDVGSVVQVAGALGLGSVLGQYLSSSGQRRQTRADVLQALAQCEQARWYHPRESGSVATASRDLTSAAMIARIPPEPVRVYLAVAGAAGGASREHWEQHEDEEYAGSIGTEMGRLVSASAGIVADLAWSPIRYRVGLGRRMKALRESAEGVIQAEDIDWDRIY